MTKSLDNLKLNELIELKSACDMLTETYAKSLTTYAEMNKDPYFQHIGVNEQKIYDKRIKTQRLSDNIKIRIEDIISEYYD